MSSSGQGQHKQITFNQNNAPAAVPVDPVSIIFSKNNAAGHPYPFFLNSQQGAVSGALPFLPDIINANGGFGFKFGNLIVNYGFNAGSSGTVTITYAVNYTSGSATSILVTPSSSVANRQVSVNTSGSNNSQFQAIVANPSTGFFYLTVGT